MTAPLAGTARYAVDGESGAWRYVGQATYVDDATGETVEHDWVRMVRVGDPTHEEWVDPSSVTRLPVQLADDVA